MIPSVISHKLAYCMHGQRDAVLILLSIVGHRFTDNSKVKQDIGVSIIEN
jgi:hypothetical protein